MSKKKLNKDKRKSVTVAMAPQLLRQVDLYCDEAQRSRSNIMCEALRVWLAAQPV